MIAAAASWNRQQMLRNINLVVRSQRFRPVIFLFIALILVWGATAAGFAIFKNSKMTAAKVEQHFQQLDLTNLDATARPEALRRLVDDINALPPDERQKYREDGAWRPLFNDMTEKEKSDFIEGTMPTGFKQVMKSFEQLSPEKRQEAIDDALKQLRQNAGNKNPSGLSAQLQQQMVKEGLKAFFTQSSAETKAELAPVVEEMQRMMEQGTLFRGGY